MALEFNTVDGAGQFLADRRNSTTRQAHEAGFKLLVKRELPLLIIRVLANLYMHNFVRVSWGGAMTDYFTALNGVKQGAVLSPTLIACMLTIFC